MGRQVRSGGATRLGKRWGAREEGGHALGVLVRRCAQPHERSVQRKEKKNRSLSPGMCKVSGLWVNKGR